MSQNIFCKPQKSEKIIATAVLNPGLAWQRFFFKTFANLLLRFIPVLKHYLPAFVLPINSIALTNYSSFPMVQHYNLEPVLTTLSNGGLILFPSDTIWAIGCDATNESAAKRVIYLKEWNYSMPLVMLVSSFEMLKQYVNFIHPRVETLLSYHNKPLTIIYDSAEGLPSVVKGKDGSAAIRIAKDDFCLQLVEKFGRPVLATSAHIGNQPFPGHFGEISSAVIQGVDHVVKHRQMEREMEPPSVIARLDENEELVFLRE